MVWPAPAARRLRALAGRPWCVALTVLAAAVVGCGGPATGDVSGKVYYQEKIVTSGTVTMIAADGVPRQGEIAEDGSYRIDKMPTGDVKILVGSPALDPKKSPRQAPPRLDPDTGKPIVIGGDELAGTEYQRKTWRELPIHYSEVARSELKYTVTAATNTHDIKLN